MVQILLHWTLHATIYEVDKIKSGGGGNFFGKDPALNRIQEQPVSLPRKQVYCCFNSQNLKLNLGILYLEAGNPPLSLVMGYHCKTSFLSLRMAEDTSILLLVALSPRQWLTN